jgi:hypothetical protein
VFHQKEALASLDGLYARCSGNPDVPRWLGHLVVAGTKPSQQADADAKKLRSSCGARQRLTMHGEVYEALAERVGSALDYDVCWQPNEYESDGFVERVRPLELTNGMLVASGCSHCGAQLLANRAEVACACGQVVSLI